MNEFQFCYFYFFTFYISITSRGPENLFFFLIVSLIIVIYCYILKYVRFSICISKRNIFFFVRLKSFSDFLVESIKFSFMILYVIRINFITCKSWGYISKVWPEVSSKGENLLLEGIELLSATLSLGHLYKDHTNS